MIDEIYDRQYQAGRSELHDGIDRLARLARRVGGGLSETFEAIRRVQFDAPWVKPRRRGVD